MNKNYEHIDPICQDLDYKQALWEADGTCCWHPFTGPVYMVVPDGHIILKCCRCPRTKTGHYAHIGKH